MQAIIYVIDKQTYEIKKDSDEIYTSVQELAEDLPDNTPRYKTSDGRLKTPLVLVYWRPRTSGQESRMLYAGAVEMMRDKAGVSQ